MIETIARIELIRRSNIGIGISHIPIIKIHPEPSDLSMRKRIIGPIININAIIYKINDIIASIVLFFLFLGLLILLPQFVQKISMF